jgi:ubiquitin-conjugating enzyme E2 S
MNTFNQLYISPHIRKLLYKQQLELIKNPPDCVIYHLNETDPLDIQADIIGPNSTPYENGIFRVKLVIPNNFPLSAPKGYFLTKIYHPNISEKGEICVNTLKKDWNPAQWSLYNVFEVIKCLLIVPFPQSALNEDAGKIFMEDYAEYYKIAKIYTNIYAIKPNNNNNNSNNIINNNNKENMNILEPKNNDNYNINNNQYKTPIKNSKTFETNNINSLNIFNNNNNLNNFNNINHTINNSNLENNNNNNNFQIYNISNIRRNISVSDSKNQKEEMKKWLERI